MKLSIIVPVYKVESYLRRCVDSILAQTFTDFELILVDDGSPDGCPAICDEYAEKDSRVKVIHKENGGLSDARNAGLDIAQGEYIGFVDSDDWIHPEMYEVLYDHANRERADIAQIKLLQFLDGTEPLDISIEGQKTESLIFTNQQLVDEYYTSRYAVNCTVCNKLYRKEIFSHIRFPVGCYYEDSAIELRTYEAANKIVVTPIPLYYYRQRQGSIMHTNLNPKWFYGTVIFGGNVRFFRKRGLLSQERIALDEYATRFSRDKFAAYIRYPVYIKEFQQINRAFLKELPNVIRNPLICKMKKIMLICSYISPKLAYRICKKLFPECLYEFMR